MTTLYLTRHGQTVWNVEKRFQGQLGSPLTERGVKEAEWLRDRIKDVEFQAIYSSPLARAYDTADIVKGDRDLRIIKDDRLKEMYFGDWEGKRAEEIKKDNEKELNNLWSNPTEYKSDKGESYQELYDRLIPAIEDIKNRHKGNVLIVAHGIVLAMIMLYVKGRPLKDLWEDTVLPNTSLTIVEAENDKFNIQLHGDISHHKNL